MPRHRPQLAVGFGVLSVLLGGCPAPLQPLRFDPVPMPDAVRIVNDNIARITGTLRASGNADVYLTLPEQGRRSYHLDATLFHLAPAYFRFDLKKFGERQILFGSNEEYYWFYNKEENEYQCGRHDEPDDPETGNALSPEQIVDALGLSIIPQAASAGAGQWRVQRVVGDFQQILFLEYDQQGRVVLEKEYWLDRYAPRLVRRVIFRDPDGVVEMQSRLDEYKILESGGPWLPGVVVAEWPKAQTRLRFRVRRWTPVDQVKAGGVQFATPRQCSEN